MIKIIDIEQRRDKKLIATFTFTVKIGPDGPSIVRIAKVSPRPEYVGRECYMKDEDFMERPAWIGEVPKLIRDKLNREVSKYKEGQRK